MKRNLKKYTAGAAVLLAAWAWLPLRAAALGAGDLLTPVGRAVAIELRAEGVLVAGLASVDTGTGRVEPAGAAGLLPGDRIVAVNGADIRQQGDFMDAMAALDGTPVTLMAERDGKLVKFTVTPAQGVTGGWYLGLWLRDGIAGIGTVTFQDPDSGLFGALGHGVCATENGSLTPVTGGAIAPATVTRVVPGARGEPGELVGVPEGEALLGEVCGNTCAGIFGYADALCGGGAVPVAGETDIVPGPAVILSTVDGSGPRAFAVDITRVVWGDEDLRQLSLCVTDPALLDITGGIVQGMSGSPILQNGKLIGAVTHVLVEDPTRGYGISMERMLQAADGARRTAAA